MKTDNWELTRTCFKWVRILQETHRISVMADKARGHWVIEYEGRFQFAAPQE